MKTFFIVNPKAGKKKNIRKLISEIQASIVQKDLDAEVYLTKYSKDATRFVREYCEQNGAARFIACGGDGTLSEVVNGAMGCFGAQVGVMPVGSGNDFCRNFPKGIDFMDVLFQTSAEAVSCDVLCYTATIGGEQLYGYCANMFNIGFDCNVGDKTNEIKEKTVFGGSFAYVLSILWNLIQKKTISLKVIADETVVYDGELLLTSVANGKYCGGGIQSNPMASITDGKINVNLIKNVSRMRFLSLLPSYMKGTHLRKRGIEKILHVLDCRKLTLIPHNENIRLCVDGEVITAEEITFRVIPGGLSFVLPERVTQADGCIVSENISV